MKWIPQDIEVFIKSKEYIDTAVLPLLPISFKDDQIKQTAAMTEFIMLLTSQLERQFRGRILLLPGFTYIKTNDEENMMQFLQAWEDKLFSESFKHVLYVTSDSDWKVHEEKLKGELIWLPTLPLDSLDEQYKLSILDDQVKQLLNLFVQKWKSEE